MGRHLSSHHPSGSYVLQDVVLERAPVGHDETFGREFLFEYYPAVAFDHSLGYPAVGGCVVPCNKVNFHRPVPSLCLCKQALSAVPGLDRRRMAVETGIRRRTPLIS